MRVYKEIYSFRVLDEIKNGEKVYLIDKSEIDSDEAIQEVNSMTVEDILFLIECDNSNKRYEFFVIEEKREENA